MTTSSEPSSPDERGKDAEARREQELRELRTTYLSAHPGWGERLVPYLFIMMETCWIDAIVVGLASLSLSAGHALFISLWAPFVLMASAYWCATSLERREQRVLPGSAVEHAPAEDYAGVTRGANWVFVALTLVTLLVAWSSIYAPSYFVLDPRWLLALLNDLLSLDLTAYHIIGIALLAVYLYWRGIRVARRALEPSDVFQSLRLGVGVIIGIIFIRAWSSMTGDAGTGFYRGALFLVLIPLFLALALMTHALTRALFLRRTSLSALHGSVAAQERALVLVIGGISVILLLVALLVGTLSSPALFIDAQRFLDPLGRAYDIFASWLAQAIVLIVTPIFWLISLIHLPGQRPRPQQPPQPTKPPAISPTPHAPAILVIALPIIKLLLPVACILVLLVLIRALLQRRRIVLVRRGEDAHESVWSWSLFWAQLRALLLSLWHRLFRGKADTQQRSETRDEEMRGEPGARSIREIYRALLQWAAHRGYPRRKNETPYEFQERLVGRMEQNEVQLRTITETYVRTRYGEAVPHEEEIDEVRRRWQELQQQGQTLP